MQSQNLDQLTSAIDVFLVMAIVIAALGVVNTLALSIIERERELGLLRAIGLTRSQTRTMVRWESVLIAFLGLILGVIVGTALGVAVVRALAFTGLGHISVPLGSLLVYARGGAGDRAGRGDPAGAPRRAAQRARRHLRRVAREAAAVGEARRGWKRTPPVRG